MASRYVEAVDAARHSTFDAMLALSGFVQMAGITDAEVADAQRAFAVLKLAEAALSKARGMVPDARMDPQRPRPTAWRLL